MAKTRTTPRTAKTTHTQTETPLSVAGVGVSGLTGSTGSSPGTSVEFSLTLSTVFSSSVLFYAVS